MTRPHKVWAIIPAGGIGARMFADRPKQYLRLHGRPVLHHTLSRICASPVIDGVVVGIRKADPWWSRERFSHAKLLGTFHSGPERANTVLNGLKYLGCLDNIAHTDWALVHDAVRPCIMQQDIENVVMQASRNRIGAVLGNKLVDTLKITDQSGLVRQTTGVYKRNDKIWRALTPQIFRIGDLIRGIEKSMADGVLATDESMAMENAGIFPDMVAGHCGNIKITAGPDLDLMDLWLTRFK